MHATWFYVVLFYVAESHVNAFGVSGGRLLRCEHVSCISLCLNYPILWFVRVACVWSETCGSTVCSWGARCVQNKCECQQCTGQPVKLVCGSDGNTYNNDCELRLASCKKQRKIEVAKPGVCDEGGFMCSCIRQDKCGAELPVICWFSQLYSGLAELMHSLQTVYCGQFNLLALTALSDPSYLKHEMQASVCTLCSLSFCCRSLLCQCLRFSFIRVLMQL